VIVVDTSALIAILLGEDDASRLEEALVNADTSLLSAGTLVELQVVIFRKSAANLFPYLDAFLRRARIGVEPVTERQARVSREAFGTYGRGSGHPAALNFGDCFAYALAKDRGMPLLFKGNDFAQTDITAAV